MICEGLLNYETDCKNILSRKHNKAAIGKLSLRYNLYGTAEIFFKIRKKLPRMKYDSQRAQVSGQHKNPSV
jgi:hypothetical protein